MSNTQGRYPFFSPSSATTPEDVIPRAEPRLLGFKLREIFKDNSIKSKSKLNWYVIKDIGKSHNH